MDADLVADYSHLSDLERRLREALRLLEKPGIDPRADLAQCGSSAVDQESDSLDLSQQKQVGVVREQIDALRTVAETLRTELRSSDESLARAVE